MGYHVTKIKKGELGEWSKVVEEWEEFMDAYFQGCSILELCELADMVGAIESYMETYNLGPIPLILTNNVIDPHNTIYRINEHVNNLYHDNLFTITEILSHTQYYTRKKYNIDIRDLYKMSLLTKHAFKDGTR